MMGRDQGGGARGWVGGLGGYEAGLMAWHAGSNAVWWCALIARYSMPSMSGGEPAVRELRSWVGSLELDLVGCAVGSDVDGLGCVGRECVERVCVIAGHGQTLEWGVTDGSPLS
jgi:hypothetical protein